MARKHRRNHKRRKGRFSFLYKLLAFLLICGAIVAAMTVFFKVSRVEISGNDRYTQEEILAASGIKTGENLFLLNKYEVAERLCTSLPYVSTVRISRQLPDALQIEVTECSHALGIQQDGRLWLLCDTGKIVDAVAPSAAKEYGIITGLTLTEPEVGRVIQSEDEAALAQLLEMLGVWNEKGMLSQVREIHLEDASVITVGYTDAFQVEFPWNADWSYKLDYLAAVIEKLEDNEKGTIILTKEGEARFIPQ